MADVVVDLRVVRGPDWDRGDEDGGEGHLGTVVEVHGPSAPTASGQASSETDAESPSFSESEQTRGEERCRVTVQWDSGHRGRYHCGEGDKYHLRVFDSAQTGTFVMTCRRV